MSDQFNALTGVPNVCQALPTLITGGQPSEAQLRSLGAAGGAIVLDVRDPMEPRPLDEPALVRQLGMEYVNIPITPGTLTDKTIEGILEVLRKAGEKPVFAHCGSGSRVAGALIPYLMLDLKMEEGDAVNQAMRMGLRSPEMLDWGVDYGRRHKAV
jgi:protein tyrosine phosphatase (PTP) superfamily phosphohydrolase (DUF442 family)